MVRYQPVTPTYQRAALGCKPLLIHPSRATAEVKFSEGVFLSYVHFLSTNYCLTKVLCGGPCSSAGPGLKLECVRLFTRFETRSLAAQRASNSVAEDRESLTPDPPSSTSQVWDCRPAPPRPENSCHLTETHRPS